MYVETIVAISETEEKARRMKAEAVLDSKRSIAEAKMRGEAMVEEAIKRAEAELAEMSKESDEAAMAAARDLAHSGDNKKAVMRARAEKRMDDAVALIVERIVKA